MAQSKLLTAFNDASQDDLAAETRNLKPDDRFLRSRGFRIHGRPAKGPVTWERGREIYVEQEALRIAQDEPPLIETTTKGTAK